MRPVPLLLLLALATACRGGPPSRVVDALRACDHAAACAEAVAAIRALDASARAGASAVEARLLALDALLAAHASYPGPKEAFLAQAGVPGAKAAEAIDAEIKDLSSAGAAGAAGAAEIAAFLAEPSCEHRDRVAAIASAGGPFARTALLAETTVVGEVLASIEPHRAGSFADAARALVGCTLSERVAPAAVLVALRNRFYDLVDACGALKTASAAVRQSCAAAKDLADTRSLPLPIGDASSGTVAGATVPVATRGLGLSFTPPWILVLSAGRLAVVDQPVLEPGVRQVRDPEDTELLDMREPRGTHVIQSVLHKTFSTRKPWEGPLHPVAALVVDRAATTSDLFEVLEALLSVSDAIAVAATLAPGARVPQWIPLNWRIEARMLLDPQGIRNAFPKAGPDVSVDLGPFSAVVRAGASERPVDVPRPSGERSYGVPDLRELHRAVLEVAPPPGRGMTSVRFQVEPAVPAGLLIPALEAVAVRVGESALSSAVAFAVASPERVAGRLSWLAPLSLLAPAPAR
ncbi:MAG: hypothetical protein FJ087_07770 [Deltaproteobacteria bacterium]|nr:hypothetical protein [Deltaproteobacteria bacterium]